MKQILIASFVLSGVCLLQNSTALAAAEQVIFSFCGDSCKDGAYPDGSLLAVGSTLYGTTFEGGAYGGGAVFSLNLSTGAEATVYSFCSAKNCSDGKGPLAGLIEVDGILYGTASEGGTYGDGVVFSIDAATGTEKIQHSFRLGTDGASPVDSLINVNGLLYGTTSEGGIYDSGTIFSLDPVTGTETVRYAFGTNAGDGAQPMAGLASAKHILYGTTFYGGGNHSFCYNGGCGTVYSFDPATDVEKVLYSFCALGTYCSDGANPDAGVINMGGTLHGATQYGGNSVGCGVVFALDPDAVERVIHTFCPNDHWGSRGAEPVGGLIDVNARLFGTTSLGGVNRNACENLGCGTVFSVNPRTGVTGMIYSFCSKANCVDGAQPYASLINVNGILYGTTGAGGSYGYGTVYSILP